MAFSYLILEFWPRSFPRRHDVWQRVLCRTADLAPSSLFFLCAIFLLSYLPFARLFAGYRAQEGSNATFRHLTSTYWQLIQFRSSLQFFLEGSLIWWILTVGLSALGVFVIVRGIYRSRPAAPIVT
jgi:uncharacterized membrane protein